MKVQAEPKLPAKATEALVVKTKNVETAKQRLLDELSYYYGYNFSHRHNVSWRKQGAWYVATIGHGAKKVNVVAVRLGSRTRWLEQ